MITFIKSGENYQFAAGGHQVATPGNHPVVGQFGISPFHQQQTQVQFQTHRIGIDPQGNLYESYCWTCIKYCKGYTVTVLLTV